MTINPARELQDAASAAEAAAGVSARLRLLCTTDLHAHLMAYDYYADADDRPFGLVRIATVIHAARAEAPNTLLLDNGDALQGSPIGDPEAPGSAEPSPVIAAMNRLGYDAAALGNHEFNHGLDWLSYALGQAAFPVTCANIALSAPPPGWPVVPSLILPREILCEDGARRTLRIGLFGLVPPQVVQWDHSHLAGRLEAFDMTATARRMVPRLRAEGADLVIALAHSGIDPEAPGHMAENAALALADIDGIDAIMTGHSHALFPDPGTPSRRDARIDHVRGRLGGTPALMAGACGTHLGVLDLRLMREAGRWRVAAHSAALRPARNSARDKGLEETLAPAHAHTLARMRQPIGSAPQRLHSYLALARPDASVAALNAVQTRLLRRAVAGTALDALPILSATPAFKTGGRGGPRNFTDLPEGALSLRHAADLYPFPNRLCGIEIDGAGLLDWLERAAICFATIRAGEPGQMLRDMDVPGHDFDVISGLSYTIDLSAQPLYGRTGARRTGAEGRIRDLQFEGRAIPPGMRFLLATNTYRAHGAGAFPPVPAARIAHVADLPLQDALAEEIGRAPLAPPPGFETAWRFALMPGTEVLLDTGPGLRSDPGALAALGARDLGDTEDGFCRIAIPLAMPALTKT
ncbi:bifunctional 2',3'-cyclic-nucleotide 2'-phosphodiesterase/3'-nucleotidase [Roseovarius aquimarinus]|uniref:Bifunctional 2',3'-cyclic-nucleotide 2'-phosphodiesterase/3'-nucleotidase n=1 Tax=Roseovarius aquimarinus TaxID=1229156 RepID=A0ABW7I6X9_9RHOB